MRKQSSVSKTRKIMAMLAPPSSGPVEELTVSTLKRPMLGQEAGVVGVVVEGCFLRWYSFWIRSAKSLPETFAAKAGGGRREGV